MIREPSSHNSMAGKLSFKGCVGSSCTLELNPKVVVTVT